MSDLPSVPELLIRLNEWLGMNQVTSDIILERDISHSIITIEQLQAAIYHCACLELVEHNTDGWGRDKIIQWFLKEYTPPEDKPE